MTIIAVEVWIAMNESGEYGLGIDAEEASENLTANLGGLSIRLVKIMVKMTPPTHVDTDVNVPDAAGTVQAQAE
jgi:hypothetical protein